MANVSFCFLPSASALRASVDVRSLEAASAARAATATSASFDLFAPSLNLDSNTPSRSSIFCALSSSSPRWRSGHSTATAATSVAASTAEAPGQSENARPCAMTEWHAACNRPDQTLARLSSTHATSANDFFAMSLVALETFLSFESCFPKATTSPMPGAIEFMGLKSSTSIAHALCPAITLVSKPTGVCDDDAMFSRVMLSSPSVEKKSIPSLAMDRATAGSTCLNRPESLRMMANELPSTHPFNPHAPLPDSRPNAAGNMECTRLSAFLSAPAFAFRNRWSSSGHFMPSICMPRRRLRSGAKFPSSAAECKPQKSSGGCPSPSPRVSLLARIAQDADRTWRILRSASSSSAALIAFKFFASTPDADVTQRW